MLLDLDCAGLRLLFSEVGLTLMYFSLDRIDTRYKVGDSREAEVSLGSEEMRHGN